MSLSVPFAALENGFTGVVVRVPSTALALTALPMGGLFCPAAGGVTAAITGMNTGGGGGCN